MSRGGSLPRAVRGKPLRSCLRVLEAAPLAVRAAFLEAVMLGAWAAGREGRRVARINLGIAFPGLAEAEAERIVRLCYVRLGTSLAEFLHIPRMDEAYLAEHFRIEGAEHLTATEQASDRGALTVTGHFGNWELMAYVYGRIVGPVAFVVRTFQDEILDAFVDERRRLGGNRTIRKSGSVKEVLRAIRSGTTVGILMDKNVKPSKGVAVDFFGRRAFTTPWVARLALATGTRVHSAFIFRDPQRRFHHTLRFGPALPMDPEAPRDEETVRLTRRCNEEIESAIRRDPAQWVWFYRRWAEKGGRGPDPYGAPPGAR